VEIDKNIFRVNCKYENSYFENTKSKENFDILAIKEKSLVFVECKDKRNFNSLFEELFEKIYKFKNVLEHIFNIKDYTIVILYLYDNKFFDDSSNFNFFKNSIRNAVKWCDNKEIFEVDKYNVFAFYTYDNDYIYDYNSLKNELNNLKKQQEIHRQKLEETKDKYNETQKTLGEFQNIKDELHNTKDELHNTNDELYNIKDELNRFKKEMNNMMSKIDLLFQIFDLDFNDNITDKKDEKSGDIIIKESGVKSDNIVKKGENEDNISIDKK
jgi:hypothetical protein